MKPSKLSTQQWGKIKSLLTDEYKDTPSVMLIRSKMREVLGFTVRDHKNWIAYSDTPPESEFTTLITTRAGYLEKSVMLDFYQESMRTLFLLKYTHIINER